MPETSRTSNVPETRDNVQHSIGNLIMKQPLSRNFREPYWAWTFFGDFNFTLKFQILHLAKISLNHITKKFFII
jgi:hypothetical protein